MAAAKDHESSLRLLLRSAGSCMRSACRLTCTGRSFRYLATRSFHPRIKTGVVLRSGLRVTVVVNAKEVWLQNL
eukprot:1211456-Prymnesium_polylepis.1